MYANQLRPIDVQIPAASPAACWLSYNDDCQSMASRMRTTSTSAWVCNPCASLFDKSKDLWSCELFMDYGPRPPCIIALRDNEPNQLALVRLSACTFRKPNQKTTSYPFFSGSVKSNPGNFEGMLGVFYNIGPPPETKRDEASRDRVRNAVIWLQKHNDLFTSALSLAETVHAYIGNDSSRRISRFVQYSSDDLKVELAHSVANQQQHRVGPDMSGLLMSVEDWPAETHEPQLTFNDLVAGVQFARGDAKKLARLRTKQRVDDHVRLVTFGSEKLEEKVFPELYCLGKGGWDYGILSQKRRQCMPFAHFMRSRLRSVDNRWRHSYFWAFWQFDRAEKHRLHGAQAAIVTENDATFSGEAPTARHVKESKKLGMASSSDDGERKEGKDESASDDVDDIKAGFLPSSITGGASYWRKKLLNLACMVRKLGTPDLFVTLTCNEWHWPELQYCRDRAWGTMNRPWDSSIAFMRRFRYVFDLIRQGKVFGGLVDFWYRLEYQQRGSPHAHIILWLKNKENRCHHVSAELLRSDLTDFSAEQRGLHNKLRDYVQRYQMHTCKPQFCASKKKPAQAPSTDITTDRCREGFPAPLADVCSMNEHGAWTYRRRHNEDRNVVPYNPTLLLLWQGGTNVQVRNHSEFGVLFAVAGDQSLDHSVSGQVSV
jgi:hypothetical protein